MYAGVPMSDPVLVLTSESDLRRHQLGDAEVEHLDELGVALALHEEDVVGLEIAMHDAGGVRRLERARRCR